MPKAGSGTQDIHQTFEKSALALDEIAQGDCATAVAERTGRRAQTVTGGCMPTMNTALRH
jgi:hypothetical protein